MHESGYHWDSTAHAPEAAHAARHAVSDRPQVICRPAGHQGDAQAEAQGHGQDEAVAPRESINTDDLSAPGAYISNSDAANI